MSRQIKDKDGRVILFENEILRITKLLCAMPNPDAYQFMIWEKQGDNWLYKQTVTDWNARE
jgi:hypothetical protein